jgi:hypothetical protein
VRHQVEAGAAGEAGGVIQVRGQHARSGGVQHRLAPVGAAQHGGHSVARRERRQRAARDIAEAGDQQACHDAPFTHGDSMEDLGMGRDCSCMAQAL